MATFTAAGANVTFLIEVRDAEAVETVVGGRPALFRPAFVRAWFVGGDLERLDLEGPRILKDGSEGATRYHSTVDFQSAALPAWAARLVGEMSVAAQRINQRGPF